MLTYRGEPGDDELVRVWRTGRSDKTPYSYFLGLDCDAQKIAIFSGTPNDPDEIIRSESTDLVLDDLTSSPSSLPSVNPSANPTFSPTTHPTTLPSQYPTWYPSARPSTRDPTIASTIQDPTQSKCFTAFNYFTSNSVSADST